VLSHTPNNGYQKRVRGVCVGPWGAGFSCDATGPGVAVACVGRPVSGQRQRRWRGSAADEGGRRTGAPCVLVGTTRQSDCRHVPLPVVVQTLPDSTSTWDATSYGVPAQRTETWSSSTRLSLGLWGTLVRKAAAQKHRSACARSCQRNSWSSQKRRPRLILGKIPKSEPQRGCRPSCTSSSTPPVELFWRPGAVRPSCWRHARALRSRAASAARPRPSPSRQARRSCDYAGRRARRGRPRLEAIPTTRVEREQRGKRLKGGVHTHTTGIARAGSAARVQRLLQGDEAAAVGCACRGGGRKRSDDRAAGQRARRARAQLGGRADAGEALTQTGAPVQRRLVADAELG
jgi:hypothetical protein